MHSFYLKPSHQDLILTPSEEESRPELIQSFGPCELALPFPLHLSVALEEKRIKTAVVEVGWCHQGIEKLFEQISWQDGVSLIARVNPNFPEPISLTYLLALEELLQLTTHIPEHVQTWRVVMLESTRIKRHLTLVYQLIHLLGSFYLKQLSNKTLLLSHHFCEQVCYSENKRPRYQLGGLSQFPEVPFLQTLMDQISGFSEQLNLLSQKILLENQIFSRLSSIGFISKETALSYGLTGPALRACGSLDDVRRSHPYFDYATYPPSLVTQTEGNAWSRLSLRMLEINASLEIIQQALQNLLTHGPHAHFQAPLESINWNELPIQNQSAFTESPDGELALTLVSDGSNKPWRVRIKTPSFSLCSALPVFLQDADIDDVILILLSLGIVGFEVDR